MYRTLWAEALPAERIRSETRVVIVGVAAAAALATAFVLVGLDEPVSAALLGVSLGFIATAIALAVRTRHLMHAVRPLSADAKRVAKTGSLDAVAVDARPALVDELRASARALALGAPGSAILMIGLTANILGIAVRSDEPWMWALVAIISLTAITTTAWTHLRIRRLVRLTDEADRQAGDVG
jgi:hypothetical protein